MPPWDETGHCGRLICPLEKGVVLWLTMSPRTITLRDPNEYLAHKVSNRLIGVTEPSNILRPIFKLKNQGCDIPNFSQLGMTVLSFKRLPCPSSHTDSSYLPSICKCMQGGFIHPTDFHAIISWKQTLPTFSNRQISLGDLCQTHLSCCRRLHALLYSAFPPLHSPNPQH